MRGQITVTVHCKSEQLILFVYIQQQTTVSPYFASKQLLLFCLAKANSSNCLLFKSAVTAVCCGICAKSNSSNCLL